ncbi:MAG: hypothetical protein DELT_02282 [Desulfovibrio sp.]
MNTTGQPSPPRKNTGGGLAGFLFADKRRALGIVAALLLCAAVVTFCGAYTARSGANAVKEKHMPLMEAALILEGRIYEALFHAAIFGSTGDMASYSGSRIRFAGIRETASQVKNFAQAAGAAEVSLRMEQMEDFTRRLDLVVEKQRTLIDALASDREKLRKAADDLGEILLNLQARTASAPASGNGSGGGGANSEGELDAKARLLALNGLALAVEAVTNQASAGLSKSAADLAVAEGVFGKRWRDAREACEKAGPDVFAHMEDTVASYRGVMGLLRFSLEEVERLASGREEVTTSLATATRGLVALVRDALAADAARTDAALFATLLFGGVLLLLAVIVGAGLVFR